MPRRTRFDRSAPLPAREHLTVREVANYLCVSRTAVYEWVSAGDVPALRKGHVIRIPRPAFLAWYQAFFVQKDSA